MDTLDILDVKEAEQWVFWKTEKGIEQTKKLQDRDVESMLQIIMQPIVSMTGCHADNDVHFNADGVQAAKLLYFFLERYMDSFIAELNEFVQCVLEIRTPPLSGIDGRIHVLIEMAAKKSYPEHRHVKLSEFEHPVPAAA